ncbi:MFS transporter [Phenylobacterium sp.]|uniref:MFS transporter n=1 Tax=Phenylobacterium sp. TaxID=1871053 RepID=UPI002DF3922E|nr:MFS transporter [Phenylobacterium sp.]
MTTSAAGAAPRLPKPDPDSLAAAILLAFLTTAGLFYVNILAALVDGLRHALAFSARDAGLIASANVYGAATGSLIAALIGPRLPWRPTAVVVLIVMTALDLGSMLLPTPGALLAVRFAHGLAGGLLVGVGISLIGRTRLPERGFGVLLFLQFGLGGLGVIVLPRLVALFGVKALFFALIAMSLTTLAMVPFISVAARDPHAPRLRAARPTGARWLALGAMGSIFIFQAQGTSVSAYALGMGEAFGLSRNYVSATVGVGTWLGLVGAGAVVLSGTRFGRLAPICASVLLTMLTGVLLVFWGRAPAMWFIANALASFSWAYVIPYIYGLCSAFDADGRTAMWAGFLSKLGLATGPAVGAFVLAETHYVRLLWSAASVAALCIVAAAPAAWVLDRAGRRGQGAPGPASPSGLAEPA